MHAATGAQGMKAALHRVADGAGPVHWAVALWAVLAVAMFATDITRLHQFFPDTDDATRLIQVREFLANGSWFDTTLERFGPNGLSSHWSRLIDLPVALLISLLALVMPIENAELLAQATWPLLLLMPLLVILARTVEALHGRTAAAVALALAATALTALLQFKPGRIDHHNAMILATVSSVFLMALAGPDGRSAYIAGLLAALSLAIGFEALPIVGLSSVALVLWAIYDDRKAAPVARYCLSFAIALVVVFSVNVPPPQWSNVKCDALSINLVILAIISAAGALLIMTRGRIWSRPLRIAVLAAAGLGATAIYEVLEPACLAGPFGQVPKAIYPIWLDTVGEARPLWWHFARMPALAVSVAAMLLAGVIAYALLLKRVIDDRLAYIAIVSVGTSLLALWQFKFVSYATWFAIPAIAILIARIEGTANVSRLAMQLLALLCLSPATLNLAGVMIAKATVKPAAAATSQNDPAACSAKAVTGALDTLPPGLIVTHIDLGPFIVATTHHRALSGPYHRLPDGIVAAHDIFASAPSASIAKLKASGARYVVDCPARAMPGVAVGAESETLLAALRRGRVPAGLTEVLLPAAAPLRIWRIDEFTSQP